ncbi:uncharacterized mitochondrial protein AtMg00810-like [Mangifera indica]|uniref:uncharacterized mitochondrial protein AtMg00810-like n=1 Tax=Mangifera indica TaxID=29780 RepID=UPI001CFAED59|nr:uncharacterized mitochondrial protein AtMg00810-like [Mangifera indica]
MVVSLYVDDLLVTEGDLSIISKFKENMQCEFEMANLGVMTYFLGIEFNQFKDGIFISQSKYASDLLEKFNMQNCKTVTIPLVANEKYKDKESNDFVEVTSYRSLIGSLLYLSSTRPDIMFSTSLLSRFMQSPKLIHMRVAKRVLRYIRGTAEFGLWFSKSQSCDVIGYSDSDWVKSLSNSKSTSGYCFSLGSVVFCWNSKKQAVVAQSSTEAEYIAASNASNQAIWLKKLLTDLGQIQNNGIVLHIDNNATIAITQNPVYYG